MSEVAFKDEALNCQTCGCGTSHCSVHVIAANWVCCCFVLMGFFLLKRPQSVIECDSVMPPPPPPGPFHAIPV